MPPCSRAHSPGGKAFRSWGWLGRPWGRRDPGPKAPTRTWFRFRANRRAMRRAVIGLGGNLGARRALLRAAVQLLADQPGLRILDRSQLYESPALGPPQPDYLNAAVLVEWVGCADALFSVTCQVEQ